MTTNELLNFPLEKIGLDNPFAQQCIYMGFATLKEITETRPEELVSKPGFSYNWLGELSEFLLKHGLLNLLQPIEGKNYD